LGKESWGGSRVTPLEKLAVDYVRLADKLAEARKKHTNSGGYRGQIVTENDPDYLWSEVQRLRGEVETMLAAIRSHVHAAYEEKKALAEMANESQKLGLYEDFDTGEEGAE
jgi:hypothetical protein